MTILDILKMLAREPSRNAKESILRSYADNETLKATFKAAYDPTINYFIKKIPTNSPSGNQPIDASLVSLKEHISSRKLTGGAAIEYVSNLLSSSSVEDAEVLARVITRDLKCGVTGSTANKIWKGSIPEFPYMRCSLVKDVKLTDWDWKNGIFSQLKADAMFANCDIVDETTVVFTSRNGTELPNDKLGVLPTDVLATYPQGVRLNGELIVERDGVGLPREISNGIVNSLVKGDSQLADNEQLIYYVWDIIPLENAVPGGKLATPYFERFFKLQSCETSAKERGVTGTVRIIETHIVYSVEDAYAHYFEVIAHGLEGTIIKTMSGKWADHTSKDQVKLKVDADVDLKIVGFTEGNGKNSSTFGSITCQTTDGLLEVNVSGFTDAKRKEIYEQKTEMVGKIITVKFNNIMTPQTAGGKYSLFLPRHVEIRNDKTEADTLDRVIEQFNSVIKPK